MDNAITKIEVQKKKKDRVNVYVDGEYSFSCSSELVYINGLKKGKIIDMNYLEGLIEEDNYLYAKSKALTFIEKTFKTENEIEVKLQKYNFNDKIIRRVIEFLRDYKFVDDSKYAEVYIKEKAKKYGKSKIRYELKRKGIKDNIIDEKLNEYHDNDEAYVEGMRKMAIKKYNSLIRVEEDKFKIKRKVGSYLLGRGYSWNEIGEVLKEIFVENY
ncbi:MULTISPECIES: recombination regulator RecX [Clostridium]|uniref:recombination regulator RecX n=1 Tax=Clostridium TaxID=1485 RepID=UPI000824A7E5|nr:MULTISPECIES: recombination regulator RecX [Clostridium]PJI09636.1 recombination regulator RecX [Clostridium sp. CT7]